MLSRHGSTAGNLHRWGAIASPECPHCGHSPQDTDHVVLPWLAGLRAEVWKPYKTTTTNSYFIIFLSAWRSVEVGYIQLNCRIDRLWLNLVITIPLLKFNLPLGLHAVDWPTQKTLTHGFVLLSMSEDE